MCIVIHNDIATYEIIINNISQQPLVLPVEVRINPSIIVTNSCFQIPEQQLVLSRGLTIWKVPLKERYVTESSPEPGCLASNRHRYAGKQGAI